MHTVFALLCFAVVIHWLIFPYPSGLLHWHCGNLTIAPVPANQPWWIWINTSCEFIMNDCITTTKQSTTKPCAYFLGYTVCVRIPHWLNHTVKCLDIVTHLCSCCQQLYLHLRCNDWNRRVRHTRQFSISVMIRARKTQDYMWLILAMLKISKQSAWIWW